MLKVSTMAEVLHISPTQLTGDITNSLDRDSAESELDSDEEAA